MINLPQENIERNSKHIFEELFKNIENTLYKDPGFVEL